MNQNPETAPIDAVRRLAQLEQRVTQLESRLGLAADAPPAEAVARWIPAATPARPAEDEMEFEVGQNWFARVGIVVLALGAGFTVSLPFASLPAVVPSLIGYALAGGLLVLAALWRNSFEMVAGHLRGVAMAMFYFATLRLYFFGTQHVLGTDSITGGALLGVVVAINLTLAYRRHSVWLLGLALVTGYVSAIAVGSAGFALGSILLLAALAVSGSLQGRWPGLGLAGVLLSHTTYLLWAANDPLLGRPLQFVTTPALAPVILFLSIVIFATGALLRPNRPEEDGVTNAGSLLNCALGYGVFLVHTLLAFKTGFTTYHLAASGVLLALAVLFWVRDRSRVSTFVYAMTGYMALSLAIIKAANAPAVFVWLSVQSVVVVATAIWFRSRFIIVANFLIYASIVLAYIFVAERETGISIGFGIVALVSARILNWQRNRLELKTELMRNAYLLGAFVVFPYALYHLVPGRYVGLAWVGLALFYYAMNLIVRNQKFRWMGHATLLVTSLYIVIVGTSRFGPVYRVLSFLALGTVMLVVSLVFTRLRKRQRAAGAGATGSP